jgi:hypothetical protein
MSIEKWRSPIFEKKNCPNYWPFCPQINSFWSISRDCFIIFCRFFLYVISHIDAVNMRKNAFYCIVLYCIVLYCIVLYCSGKLIHQSPEVTRYRHTRANTPTLWLCDNNDLTSGDLSNPLPAGRKDRLRGNQSPQVLLPCKKPWEVGAHRNHAVTTAAERLKQRSPTRSYPTSTPRPKQAL